VGTHSQASKGKATPELALTDLLLQELLGVVTWRNTLDAHINLQGQIATGGAGGLNWSRVAATTKVTALAGGAHLLGNEATTPTTSRQTASPLMPPRAILSA
jgi:hypothetical protein